MLRSISSLVFALFFAGSCSSAVEGPANTPLAPETQEMQPTPAQATEQARSPARVAIRHILIAHDESKKRHAMVSRSASEALSLAQSLKKQIESGESMAKLAKRHSNDPTASRGGFLGASERGSWVPEFENTAFSLRVGEVSEPVETVFGIHILRREPLEEIRLSHILVAHKDAQGVAKKTSEIGQRSPEAALRIAQLALKDLDDGTSFPEVAEQFSDGPMGRRGAHLGWFVRGELGPTFDQAAFALDVGETSAVFESVFGYHIIRREE